MSPTRLMQMFFYRPLYPKYLKKKRSQLSSIDLMIALTIFAVLFFSIASTWDDIRVGFSNVEKKNDFEALSHYGMESLIGTAGNPQNWGNQSIVNASTVASLGLGSGHYGIVSQNKISSLIRMNATSYPAYKEILGIRGANYEFALNITQYSSTYNLLRSDMVGYTGQCKSVIKINRAAFTDNGNYVFFDYYGCRT